MPAALLMYRRRRHNQMLNLLCSKIKPQNKVPSNKATKRPGLERWKIDFRTILRIKGSISVFAT